MSRKQAVPPPRIEKAPDPAGLRTTVLIVDDHELLRAGLRALIDNEPDLLVCGEAEDEPSAARLIRQLAPAVVIVDLSLSAGSGLDLIKWIRKQNPDTKIIVSTVHEERLFGERSLRAGASGYVCKHDPARTILRAIREVLLGRLFFSDELTNRVMHRVQGDPVSLNSALDPLSDRELEIFRLIGQGLSTARIAAKLNLSQSTVNTYRERIKLKLGLQSKSELNIQAVNWREENV